MQSGFTRWNAGVGPNRLFGKQNNKSSQTADNKSASAFKTCTHKQKS